MKDRIIQTILCVLGGFFGFLFGGLNGLMLALIALMIIDYATGVLLAIVNKDLSSKIGFKGIAKKVFMLSLIAVAHILDVNIIGKGGIVMGSIQCFYIANEGISIVENASKLGVPLPKKLVEILKQLKNESEEK